MDFVDPRKKRAHRIRLMIGYVLIGIAIGLGSVVLAGMTFGYRLGDDGALTRNGLVYIAAQPQTADIYLNGEKRRERTDTRINLPEGEYNLELRREGYRSWRRDFTLAGGSIERYVYPFLFPTELKTRDLNLYASEPPLATASPDRQWLLVQVPGSVQDFDVFDMNSDEQPSLRFTLAPGLLTTPQADSSLKAVEWSTDNRHLLLEHTYPGGREFVLLDRDKPAESINLSRTFGRTPTRISLRDKRYDRYYFYSTEGQTLEIADLKSRAVSPLLTGVIDYKAHDDQYIVYATAVNAPEGKTRIMVRDGDGTYVLRDIAASDTYLLEMARFESKWHIVAGSKTEGKAYVYRDPFDRMKQQNPKLPLVSAILEADGADYVSFSNNARFVMAQGGKNFATFDLETLHSYRYEVEIPLDAGTHTTWMDGHRLVATSEGKTIVFDYDGINMQTLSAVSQPNGIFFDRDYTGLYNVAPSVSVEGRSAITRTELLVED